MIQCWEWFSRTPNDVPNHWQCILHDSKTNFSFRFLPVIILAYDRDFFGGVVDGKIFKVTILTLNKLIIFSESVLFVGLILNF